MNSSKDRYSEVFWFRVILGIGVIAIPLFGLMMKQEVPNCTEFMGHRVIMSISWLSLIILSLTTSFFKKHLVTISCWLFFILNVWVIWIVYLNNFNLYYCAGFFVSFCAMNITYCRPKLYFPFFIITILMTIAACWICPKPELSVPVLLFVVIILGIVFMLTTKIIINTQNELNELNLTLEKKVALRTAEAENKSKLLISKNKELEQLAYITSHDLKSPLRNIGGFMQLIQRKLAKETDQEIKEYMAFVVSNVKKMDSIIRDILHFARFDVDPVLFNDVDIGELVQDVCAGMKQEIQSKDAIVRFHNLNKTIWCNKKQLALLFQNLIENGLKYNTSSQPTIDISLRQTHSEFVFSVKDNGIGIQAEYEERIFKIFQRLHTDQQYPGTGIGLAICKKIVETHEGKIWLQSTPGEGTTFFFSISKNLAKAKEALEMAESIS